MFMKSRLSLVLVIPLLLVALLASGCKSSGAATSSSSSSTSATGTVTSSGATAGCPTSNTTSFAKTKFVLHSGLAFGAFHRYIYKPFRAGQFHSGAHGRLSAAVKAGLAALFIKREIRLAYGDAKANPTLCKAIAAPLQAVGNKIGSAVSSLRGGDTTAVTSLEQTVQDTKSKAASAGTTIQEDPNAPLH